MSTVVVTGATGFIALHTIKLLLEKGYKVIGTARTQKKADTLVSRFNNENFNCVYIEDITKEGAHDKLFLDNPEIKYVLHIASPSTLVAGDPEKDLLIPAIEGTKSILKSIKLHAPQVERVVYTTSVIACVGFEDVANKDIVLDERSWNPITWEKSKENGAYGYAGSKTFAEKAAWDFVEKEKPNFVLTTVAPSAVVGVQLFDEDMKDEVNASNEILNNILKIQAGETEYPKFDYQYISSHDVALAHILAFEKEETKNERLLLVAGPFNEQTLLNYLNTRSDMRGKIPIGEPNKPINQDVAIWNTDRTKRLLGIEYQKIDELLPEVFSQLIDYRKRTNQL